MAIGNVSVVLVHGAWADGSSWSKVIERLEGQGIRAVAAPLPPPPARDVTGSIARPNCAQNSICPAISERIA